MERKERHRSGYSFPLPGGGLVREEGEDAAVALVGRTGSGSARLAGTA